MLLWTFVELLVLLLHVKVPPYLSICHSLSSISYPKMMFPFSLPFLTAFLPSLTMATNLYVASYAGNITSLSLLKTDTCDYNLTQTSTFNTSTHTPSWLTLNKQNNVLYMVDEAVNNTNGTVVAYRTSFSGKLTELDRIEDIGGGVYAAFFANGGALAVPH